jgi:hypothetical protein
LYLSSLGVEFNILPGPPANYRYQLWYNTTLYSDNDDNYNAQLHRLMRGIDEAISKCNNLDNVYQSVFTCVCSS